MKTDAAVQVVMSLKFGAKPIEFEKGKAGIVVPSKDNLPTVIDTLIAAVWAGELDERACRGRLYGMSIAGAMTTSESRRKPIRSTPRLVDG